MAAALSPYEALVADAWRKVRGPAPAEKVDDLMVELVSVLQRLVTAMVESAIAGRQATAGAAPDISGGTRLPKSPNITPHIASHHKAVTGAGMRGITQAIAPSAAAPSARP